MLLVCLRRAVNVRRVSFEKELVVSRHLEKNHLFLITFEAVAAQLIVISAAITKPQFTVHDAPSLV